MALRIIETFVPEELAGDVREALAEASAHQVWQERGPEDGCVVRAVIGAGRTGAAMDLLYERFSRASGFRVLVLPLDAIVPRPTASLAVEDRKQPLSAAAVSREELYAKISDASQLSGTYLAMVALATTVAAIGLAKNNVAAVIGAMLVAPLLGPNMGLALGLMLADAPLVRSAIKTNIVGLGVAVALAFLLAQVLPGDPGIPEIESRIRLDLFDMLLALAAGCAGTLAYTTGAPSYLIGVMVAVALLPPAVAGGLLLGDGHPREALGAFLLVVANVTAVNLAGMLTFLAKGMGPRLWWKAERARTSARRGIGVWVALLVLLSIVVVASQTFWETGAG